MSYLDRIAACHQADLSQYQAWYIAGQVYGYLLPSFSEVLQRWTTIFQFSHQGVHFCPDLQTCQERTDVLTPILQQLHQEAVIDTWVGETYPVTLGFDQPAQCEMERAATLYFGVKTFGVHVNGLVRKPDGIYVWVGRRTLAKPFWPGKLDQLVAGGQPFGLSLLDNVMKEAQEEANIPRHLAQQAKLVSQLNYQQTTPRGLENSTIFSYDLWLPEDFVPKNNDGEVRDFYLLSLAELAQLTETTTDFKDNCNLVNIDLLLRQGYITARYPDVEVIRQTLYCRFS